MHVQFDRIVPAPPPAGQRLRLIIDTDFANEIDDLYAAALALSAPDRFAIEGFVLTHFNNENGGPGSIEKSYSLFARFMEAAGYAGKYPMKRSAPPTMYYGYPSEGEGVDFIIERASAGSAEDPLWVVCLGAATNLASAILKEPAIKPKIRYVFHARSNHTWPERSVQFNVLGDIHAARTLLKEWAPLVWFDTGTQLKISMEHGAQYIASTGPMGKFIHEYRYKHPHYQTLDKGFFDMGDIAWLIDDSICKSETVYAPAMDPHMYFNHGAQNGKMLRVYDIDSNAAWNMLHERLRKYGANAKTVI